MRSVRGILALALAALACGTSAPAAAQAPLELSSGPLTLRIAADPFALEVVDTSDGDALRTGAPPPRSGGDLRGRYAPLGYSFDLRLPVVNNAYLGYYAAAEVETVRFQATRVVSSEARDGTLSVVAATNDPLGHRLLIEASPAGEGGISLRSRIAPGSGPLAGLPSVSSASFEAAGGERYLGFGERSNAVDQTGGRVFSWAEEGPFSGGDYEGFLNENLPGFVFPTGPSASNFPIPWLVSTRGLGVLVDQPQRSTFNLRNERSDRWQVEAEAPELRLSIFAGPKPADVVRRYSAYAGRQPDPAGWIFGPWVQTTLESRPNELIDRFRAEDVPVTVRQTYTHYLPCGAHRGREEAERELVESAHARGYKITTYFNPHVCLEYSEVYDDAARRGLFVKNALGRPYVLSNPFTADEQVSEIDFTHPEGRALYHRLLDAALDRGYDGWMEDFGEYTPTDSVASDGRRGLELHNAYPVLYHCASTEHTARRRGNDVAVYIRSGYHGVQPCARVVWGGDPTEDWSCTDGLCAAVHQALSTGLSGIAYWGSDIGGFHAIVNRRTNDELNIRWLQFGAVSGVMRTQANGFSFRNDRASRSQVWHPAVMPHWRRYTKLRTQLHPYIAAASERYQRDGTPLTRHLALVFPGDERAAAAQTEFLFGPDLFAAPVVEPGARRRTFHLPAGDWVDLWRSAAYDEATGSLRLGSPRLVAGGETVELPAPIEELPLLVRAGSVLPLLPADVDTLADVGSGEGLVHASDRAGRLELLAFPRGRRTAALAGGERLRSLERRGSWTLRIDGRRARRYGLQASLRTLRAPFAPRCVLLGGRALPRRAWRYNRATGVLTTSFRTRSARLQVLRRC